MLSFFPRGVLDEILSLVKSVSEDFPSYSLNIIDPSYLCKSLTTNTKLLRQKGG